jgi:cytochrome P450
VRRIDFLAPGFLDDPYPTYARFRAERPVWPSVEIGMVCVFRYADLRTCLTSPDFTVEYPFRVSKLVLGESLLDLDGPRHKRLRRLLAGLLQGREDNVEFGRAADAAAAAVVAGLRPGRTDFVADVARVVPLAATAAFLGIPADGLEFVRPRLDYLLHHLDGSRGDVVLAAARRRELEDYAGSLMPSAGPDTVLGRMGPLVRAGTLTHAEAVGSVLLVLAAGVETSTGLLSNMMWTLLRHPRWLPDAASGERVRPVVREVLRWEPPQHDTVRFAARDTTLGGVPLPRGTALKLLLASGNRDFPAGEEFDPARPVTPSLSFGFGAHSCLGTHLASRLAETLFPALLGRFPRPRADGPLPPITGSTFRRPVALPLMLAMPCSAAAGPVSAAGPMAAAEGRR